jgi:hypothetical protein
MGFDHSPAINSAFEWGSIKSFDVLSPTRVKYGFRNHHVLSACAYFSKRPYERKQLLHGLLPLLRVVVENC